MAGKKEEWRMKKDGNGVKISTRTHSDGSKTITTQKAHTDVLLGKRATSIRSVETRSAPKKHK